MPRVLRPLFMVSTYRRWAYLLLGGALAACYGTLALALAGLFDTVALVALFLPVLVVLTGLVPELRPVERVLCATLLLDDARAGEQLEGGDSRSWPTRWRTTWWFAMHFAFGALVTFATVLVVIAGVMLTLMPVVEGSLNLSGMFAWTSHTGWASAWGPFAAVALVLLLVYLVAGCGRVLVNFAARLLGPSTTERLELLERRTERLLERNRLARELHDSVGHALTTTTLQAAAAARVLDTNPEFARQALSAIEEIGRSALEDLDHVLGLLRDGAAPTVPQRGLADLDQLLDKTRSLGVQVQAEITGSLDRVPGVIGRETFRIVQEGLTNVLRHAGSVQTTLRIAVHDGRMDLAITNPVGAASPTRNTGGRGLRGVRERVSLLGGEMSAEPVDGQWRVRVQLPLGGA